MAAPFLETSIEYLKGVGPQRAELLRTELDIHTFGDLLFHFPFRYVDRSVFVPINTVRFDQQYVQIKGTLQSIAETGPPRRKRLVARLSDDSGSIDLTWFQGTRWIKSTLQSGKEYVVFGKPNLYGKKLSIAHPEMDLAEKTTITGNLQGVYSTTEKLTSRGLNSKGLLRLLQTLCKRLHHNIAENLPASLLGKLHLPSREQAVLQLHFPENRKSLEAARYRMKFEELLFIQLELLSLQVFRNQKLKGNAFEVVGEQFNRFYNEILPFSLTNAQKRVIKEIRKDLGSGTQMNRLLQGDVGSGKTMVALMSMLIAIDNGYQCCLMAPTEILANQHYETIANQVRDLGIEVALLTGSTKSSARKSLHERLQTGVIHILIGTHALIEDTVQYDNIGLVVIDEQHRFGVAQRAKLWKKNERPPHVLVMTATPIPRTLAMTLYGDLDVSVIDELPPGRKPVKTNHRYDSARLQVFGFMKEQLKKGYQVYVVYPLIQESDKLDYKNLEEGYEAICRAFQPEFHIGILHGQMKPEDKDLEMKRFVKKETQILVATNVIEVGVNVPNATLMVIESAERFGLSQLHQLRGRVGRGGDQSYCILITSFKLSEEGKERMKVMSSTNDGFEIAEADLKLRGPGDLLGTQQSGILDMKIADLSKDGQILMQARTVAKDLLKEDPALSQPHHRSLRQHLDQIQSKRKDWSRIS